MAEGVPTPARARTLIKKLALTAHPEGGYYRENYRSATRVEGVQGRRSALTTIYFLLLSGQSSLLHRVESDEAWHFYEGAPLKLIDVTPTMKDVQVHYLGPERGRSRQNAVIPRGHWQAAVSTGAYSLVGCSVAPGFEFEDFTLLRDDATARAKLARLQPKLAHLIG